MFACVNLHSKHWVVLKKDESSTVVKMNEIVSVWESNRPTNLFRNEDWGDPFDVEACFYKMLFLLRFEISLNPPFVLCIG